MPDVLMPRLSDTMEEGLLSQWLKKEGDEVHKGDALAEIETDKATMELEAYDEGVLERLLVPEGTIVPIGAPIAVIGGVTGTGPTTPPAAASPAEREPVQPAVTGRETAHHWPPPAGARPIRTSPLARRIARDHGIDLATISGTGPGGRIVRADVEASVAADERRDRPASVLADYPPAPGARVYGGGVRDRADR